MDRIPILFSQPTLDNLVKAMHGAPYALAEPILREIGESVSAHNAVAHAAKKDGE